MPDRRQHRGPHPEDIRLFGTPAAAHTLRQATAMVATSDSGILDAPVSWYDLAATVVAQTVPTAWCLDLDVAPPVVVEACVGLA